MNRNAPNKLISILGTLLSLAIIVYFFYQARSDWQTFREKQEKGRAEREARQQKIKAARDLITRAAKCPRKEFAEVMKCKDPWNNDLILRGDEGSVTSKKIICKGPDEIADTADDIYAHRDWKINWTKAGEKVGKASGDAARGIVKGIVRSIWEGERQQEVGKLDSKKK